LIVAGLARFATFIFAARLYRHGWLMPGTGPVTLVVIVDAT
jgi:hypothetical protein